VFGGCGPLDHEGRRANDGEERRSHHSPFEDTTVNLDLETGGVDLAVTGGRR